MNNLKFLSGMLQKMIDSEVSGNQAPAIALSQMDFEITIDGELIDDGAQYLLKTLMLYVKLSEDDIRAANGIDRDDKTLFLKKIDRVNLFLIDCMNGQTWNQVKGSSLTQDYIDAIRMASTAVKSSGTSSIYDEKFAKNNIDKLREIVSSIKKSNIPEHLKSILCSELLALIHIFETFEVFGCQDAEHRVKKMIADLVMYGNDISDDDKKNLTGLTSFLWENMNRFRKGVGILKAGEYVVKLFGPET